MIARFLFAFAILIVSVFVAGLLWGSASVVWESFS